MKEKFKFTRDQAIEILNCKQDITNSRINYKLKKLLNAKIITIGRGDNVYFIAHAEVTEVSKQDQDKYYYYSTFKKYLIDCNFINTNTDYNKFLELIEIYIDNRIEKQILTLDILRDKLNISKNTINRYNKLLQELNIIKSLKECEKKVIIKDTLTQEYKELDYNYYYNFLINRMNYFVNRINEIYLDENNHFKKVHIYSDLRGYIQVLDEKFYSIQYDIELANYDDIDDIDEYEDYKTKTIKLDLIESAYCNNRLYKIILDILYRIHDIEELKIYKVRTITTQLANDPDLMLVLKSAILYMKELKQIEKSA